ARRDGRDENVAVAHQLVARREFVFRNLGNHVGSRTVVDHFRLRPDARVFLANVISDDGRNRLGPLFAAARNRTLSIGADLHVVTRPEFVFRLAVAAFGNGLEHQLRELIFQVRKIDSILRSLWTGDAWSDRADVEIEYDAVIDVALL